MLELVVVIYLGKIQDLYSIFSSDPTNRMICDKIILSSLHYSLNKPKYLDYLSRLTYVTWLVNIRMKKKHRRTAQSLFKGRLFLQPFAISWLQINCTLLMCIKLTEHDCMRMVRIIFYECKMLVLISFH